MSAPMVEVDAHGAPLAPINSNKASTEIGSPVMASTSIPPASSTGRSKATVPSGKIRLDVLLITGQRHFFDFEPGACAKAVREHVWSHWPEDWPSRPAAASAFKILHLGHILDDKTTLSCAPGSGDKEAANSRRMSIGKTTVVHLLVRQQPLHNGDDTGSIKKKKQPKAGRQASEDDYEQPEEVQSGCRCIIC